MAGDWIKMRSNLWDDPRIASLCDMTDCGEAAIVGALYWLWSAADQHTEDGIMPGLTLRSINRKTGVNGFGEALIAIGWIADHPEGVRIVRFEEHNGSSAKRRCSESRRKMSARDADTYRTDCGHCAEASQQSCAPRERDREEKSQQPISDQPLVGNSLPPATPQAKAIRGTRLPGDWQLPKDWGDWAMQERVGWAPADVRSCADRFRDYWIGLSGQKATKTDWLATWRNWVRNDQGRPPARASPAQSRDEGRRQVLEVLTGVGRNEQRSERDITGEVRRIA